MKQNEKYTTNKCIAYKSLPNILFPLKSNLHTSKSLPCCLTFVQKQSQSDKKVSISNRMNIENKKKLDPTIGELLGDDDLFHYHYHNQYSSTRFKQTRFHYRSYSRSPYIHRRKQRRSNYLNTTQEFQHPPSSSKFTEPITDTNQLPLYPTTYNYTPIPAYCYHCYSNMTSYCPCLISDYSGGLYQQEICYERPIF